MITNSKLNDLSKKALTFCLQNVLSLNGNVKINRLEILKQINCADVTIEETPYYCIIKFIHDGITCDAFDKTIDVQVLKEDRIPIVFHLHFNNNLLVEFEYYKADSSEIDKDIFIGDMEVVIN